MSRTPILSSIGSRLDTEENERDPNMGFLENRSFNIGNTLFVPVYVGIVIKAIKNLDPKNYTVKVPYTLNIRINVTNLSQSVQDLIKEKFRYRFDSTEIIPSHYDYKSSKSHGDTIINFVVRKESEANINPKMHDTPFDVFNIPIQIEIP
jgi:hypothetical protein